MKSKRLTSLLLLVLFIALLVSGVFLLFSTSGELRDALSASTTAHAESIAVPLLKVISELEETRNLSENGLFPFSESLTEICRELYARFNGTSLAHIALIAPDGKFLAHSDNRQVGRSLADVAFPENEGTSLSVRDLGWRKTMSIRDAAFYHYLIPVVDINTNEDLATIDLAYPHSVLGTPIKQFWTKGLLSLAGTGCVLLPVLAIFLYVHITAPLWYLIQVGERMSQGHTIDSVHLTKRKDELARLGMVLVDLSKYFQEVTELATQIASGNLGKQAVEKRSKRDVLGSALQDMLAYLQTLSKVATTISEGDLSMTIPIRSDIDNFGKSLHKMTSYLQEMADVATTVSTGDLRKRVHPQSERDVLGTAFSNMIGYLRHLSKTATHIADGDLQQDSNPVSEYDVLGNAFHTMTVQLRENFEKIQQEVAERTRAQGALQELNEQLEQRVEERTAEITRQTYILDTFMANVPDSIYFKDRDSRMIRCNRALAKRFHISDPSELVGKTDFDFFPEAQARPKFEQEQEIIRSGKPMLGTEEPDADNRWSLTTKMPLRDENNDIIGTFGISRDITELKQTQQGLEEAYNKIHQLNEKLQDENFRMGAEMELAQRIQTSLLPVQLKQIHSDFEIAATMLPADEVGGDYYDIAYDLEQNLWFSIGDVSGHGVTPGLIMMMAQTIHTAITTNYHVTPKDVVVGVNKALFRNVHDRLKAKHFMTFTTLKYLGDGRFLHAGAHLDLIVYRQRTGQCELIDTHGTFLNFIPDISHATDNAEFSIDPGDLLVLYTDGLTEAANLDEELLDVHRFREIITRHATERVERLKDAVLQDVLAWSDGKRADDMSLVVIRRV